MKWNLSFPIFLIWGIIWSLCWTHVLAQTALPSTGTDISNTNTNNTFAQGLFVQSTDDYLFYFNNDGSAPDFVIYDLNGAQVDSIIPGNNLMVNGSMIRDTFYFAMARDNSSGVNRQVHWFAPGPADQAFVMAYGANPWIRSSSYTLIGDDVFFVGKNPNSSNASRSKLLRLGIPRDTSALEIASDLNSGNDEILGNNIRSDLDAGILGFGPTGSEFVLYRGSNGTSGFEYFIYNRSSNTPSLLIDVSATENGAFANGVADPANRLPLPVSLTNGNAIFPAYSDTSDVELWVTDGTVPNTQQITNINSGGGIDIPTSGLVSIGNMAIFAANSGNGLDLWQTDGVSAMMIADINAAGDDSIRSMAVNDTMGLVLFSADNGTDGNEPWVTDGTPGGTMMLADINPNGTSNPRRIMAVNGGFIFVADNGTDARIFFTDGTSANTLQLDNRSIYTPYLENVKFVAASSTNVYFADVNGTIFQAAIPTGPNQAPNLADANYLILDSVSGEFVIDTLTGQDPEGSPLSYSIVSGNGAGNFVLEASNGELTVAMGAMFDIMTTPSYILGVEISDGALTDTAEITIDLFEAFPSSPQALPFTGTITGSGNNNNQYQNGLYVGSDDQSLYYFNGDAQQDVVFYDLNRFETDSIIPGRNILNYGRMIQDTLYFCASRNASLNQNRNVQWVVPGSAEDFYQIDYGGNPWVYGAHYQAVGNSIFLVGKIPGSSNQGRMKLLRIGPSRDLAGFSLAADENSGNDEFIGGNFPAVYDVAVTPVGPTGNEFALYRGSNGTDGYEYFLYRLSDSTVSLLGNLSGTGDGAYANGVADPANRLPLPVSLVSGQAIFPAYSDTSDVELWITDGINSQQISNLNPNGGINLGLTGLVSMGDSAYFGADTGNGQDLWMTDGTANGTQLLIDINPNGNDSIADMTVHNGRVIFSAVDGTGDREPWITDGSNTQMLSNVNPAGSSNPRLFTAAGDGFVFVANDGTNDLLYYTDGNPGSVILLDTRINYVPYGPGQQFLAATDQFVYFGDTMGTVYRVTIPGSVPNLAPTIDDVSFTLSDQSAPGTSVGSMTANDPEGQMLSFALLSGNTDNDFELNVSTGEITVATGATLDADNKPQYMLEIEVSDGVAFDTSIATIDVFAPNTAPIFIQTSIGPFDLLEDAIPGTVVGTVEGEDGENDPLSFQIIAGNSDGNFTIGNGTGVIEVAPGGSFDFDLTSVYNISVTLSDGELADTADIQINILEVVSLDPSILEQVEIVPNPFLDAFNLKIPLPRSKSYQVLDLQGRIIQEGSFETQEVHINLSDITSGMYILSVLTEQGSASWKIQKR
ncbi:MAG: cadherin domain-containing protein [Bacteroidota bacterium]